MKVCYLTPDCSLAGAGRSLLDMLAGLDRRKVSPVVIAFKSGPMEEILKEMNIPCIIVPSVKQGRPRNPVKYFLKIGLYIPSVLNLIRIFHGEKFDLIHTNTYGATIAMEAAAFLGIPYIVHLRECDWEGCRLNCLFETRFHKLLEKAACCIAITDVVRKKFLLRAPKANIVVKNDAINAENYVQTQKNLLKKETVSLLMLGRIEYGKGQFEAVQAMKSLIDQGFTSFTLKLVGRVVPSERDYYKKIVNFIDKHQLHQIEFIPFQNEPKSLYHECDIYLMCSVYEAMGRVTIESMLARCVTIGATSAATPELIKDGINGFLYRSGDPEDLAKKILYVLEHRDEMDKLTQRAQAMALKRYDISAYGEFLLNIYSRYA